jgi:aspartate/methionine/tyrosine aminotransferase
VIRARIAKEIAHSLSKDGFRASVSEHRDLEERLLARIGQALLPERPLDCHLQAIITGSVAIDRVLMALRKVALNRGLDGVNLITPSPFFDLPILLSREVSEIRHTIISWKYPGGDLPVDQLCAAVKNSSAGELAVIFIASPDNPSGEIWTRDKLEQLARACSATGAILCVDHCFLFAGTQPLGSVPKIWDIGEHSAAWIAIWDTGKTFALGGEKLAVSVTNDLELDFEIRKAVEIIQYELPLTTLATFERLFSSDAWICEVQRLHEICSYNLALLEQSDLGRCILHVPQGSTLAVIELPRESEELAMRQLENGAVGVVSCRAFFHDNHSSPPLIRISLARMSDYFSDALLELGSVLRTF